MTFDQLKAVGAVPYQPGGVELEALHCALDHVLSRKDFSLTDRRRRLDIDDDLTFPRKSGRRVMQLLPLPAVG